VVICLERSADLHTAQLMPLPLTVSCFSKIQIGFTFLVAAHRGSPGKRAIKRVCVYITKLNYICSIWSNAPHIHITFCSLIHTHTFNGPFPGTIQVSRYQKGNHFTEARDSEWQWHQLGNIQVCTSLQTDNHANTHHSVFTGRMPFLPPNQQRQSTAGNQCCLILDWILLFSFTIRTSTKLTTHQTSV